MHESRYASKLPARWRVWLMLRNIPLGILRGAAGQGPHLVKHSTQSSESQRTSRAAEFTLQNHSWSSDVCIDAQNRSGTTRHWQQSEHCTQFDRRPPASSCTVAAVVACAAPAAPEPSLRRPFLRPDNGATAGASALPGAASAVPVVVLVPALLPALPALPFAPALCTHKKQHRVSSERWPLTAAAMLNMKHT